MMFWLAAMPWIKPDCMDLPEHQGVDHCQVLPKDLSEHQGVDHCQVLPKDLSKHQEVDLLGAGPRPKPSPRPDSIGRGVT